jgi:hypothetical protein
MPNVGENWVCPYCGHAQVVTKDRHDLDLRSISVEECALGDLGYGIEATICANIECKKLSLDFFLVSRGHWKNSGGFEINGVIQNWRLLPSSFARPQPDYIPERLRRDYEEACAIRDLSANASATITRRCIQGIIRDFCGITKKRLVDEINELRDRVNAGNAPAGVYGSRDQSDRRC